MLLISQPGCKDEYVKTWIRKDHIAWVCECELGDSVSLVCVEYPHSMLTAVWDCQNTVEEVMLMLRD
jgi:hypothetical protein